MAGKTTRWTSARIAEVKKILGKSKTLHEALIKMSARFGKVTPASLTSIFRQTGDASVGSFVGRDLKSTAAEPSEALKKLYQAARKTIKFSALCDYLDMSPSKVRALIDEAWELGVAVKVTQDHVGIDAPATDERLQETQIAPVKGKRQVVGVISDTHLGSRYCLRAQLKDFVEYAYKQGAREILHPGDMLDGDYKHGKFEMSHMGIDEQTRDLFDTLPRLPGLGYHAITGNHDETFASESGINVGRYIQDYFESRGRKDFKAYGDRGAFLKIRGVVVHLWHPRSGGAYALSYPLMKKIESYSVIKPQVLLAGHWHRHVTCYERGIHAIACPTFQAPTSAFSKSLASAPAIGGLILSWDLTVHGTMRSFIIEKRSYFEREEPIQIYNTTDAIEVVK